MEPTVVTASPITGVVLDVLRQTIEVATAAATRVVVTVAAILVIWIVALPVTILSK